MSIDMRQLASRLPAAEADAFRGRQDDPASAEPLRSLHIRQKRSVLLLRSQLLAVSLQTEPPLAFHHLTTVTWRTQTQCSELRGCTWEDLSEDKRAAQPLGRRGNAADISRR